MSTLGPSEEEIRDKYSYFVKTSRGDCLHLLDPDNSPDDPLPLCGFPHGPEDKEWVSKSMEVFPLGYLPICEFCREELIDDEAGFL